MGHEPCKMEQDIWLRDCGENYENISAHVDNLLIVSKDPQCAVDTLTKKHNLKLKGTAILEEIEMKHCTSLLGNASKR